MSETTTGGHDSPEELRKHIRGYLIVGGILYVGTILTVMVATFNLAVVPAIALALAIASTKATLVALFFMHLIDEKKLIRWTLMLTASFFVLCMALPSMTTYEGVGDPLPDSQARAEKHLHGTEHEGAEPAAHEGAH
jgi:cytochrome c oxidase subunit 4